MSLNNKLLKNRGIGSLYHEQSLTTYDHPTAQIVLSWVQNEANPSLLMGSALNFVGTSYISYDIAILAARALILSKYDKLRVTNFRDAITPEFISLIYDQHPPLMILNFNPSAIDEEGYSKLENCLTYYLDNRIPVFLHAPVNSLDELKEEFVNPVFVSRLKTLNREIYIH